MKTLILNREDIELGDLILVNSSNPISYELANDTLSSVRSDFSEILLEGKVAEMLAEVTDLLNCERKIVPVSGFRTLKEQQKIYSDSMHENGREFTQKYVAIPGCSEHQTGLAIDLAENKSDIDFIRPSFPYAGVCQEFRKVSVKYGFIERYPKGRESITQIAHEPWHFRYVGYPHSKLIYERGLVLEEYIEHIKGFSYGNVHLRLRYARQEFEIFYVPMRSDKSVEIMIQDGIPFQISGNNDDGFIITLWGHQI